MSKRLLVDADGVLVDFTNHLYRLLYDKFGDELLHPSQYTKFDMIENHLNEEQRLVAEEILSGVTFWNTQPPIQGAVESVAAMRTNDIDIHFVTSPYKKCFGWADVRRDYLHTVFDAPYDHIHVTAGKYVVEGDGFIDDKPDNVSAWRTAHPDKMSWLFAAPYNRFADPTIQRINGWQDGTAEYVALRLLMPSWGIH